MKGNKNMKEQYLRIGIDYYIKESVPTINGEQKPALIRWNRATIIDDHGKDLLNSIDKYKGFCTVPSHNNFKEIVGEYYNKYTRLPHQLSYGSFDNTEVFLRHIFAEHYDLALDYIGVLWHHPYHVLPILSIVSSERNTGKTTFLNWLMAIFGRNMTINKNEDFRSQFNSDWADKLIVGIDEVLLDKKEDSELLKSLSTAKHSKIESKGKDKLEIDFFAKFILASNNEESFVKIDQEEIRYWVRKVPTLKTDDPFLMDKLIAEIPHFLHFINNRRISTPKQTRMWFTPKQIWTEALDKLKKGNKTFNEKQLLESIEDAIETYEVDKIKFSTGDLVDLMKTNNLRIPGYQITKLLNEKWNLKSKNSSYKKYISAFDYGTNEYKSSSTLMKGRCYTFTREIIHKIQNQK